MKKPQRITAFLLALIARLNVDMSFHEFVMSILINLDDDPELNETQQSQLLHYLDIYNDDRSAQTESESLFVAAWVSSLFYDESIPLIPPYIEAKHLAAA